MKNKKIWSLLLIAVFVLQIVAEVIAATVILRLNMLPVKFIVLLIGVLAVPLTGTALLMFLKIKGEISNTRKIIACVLALLVIALCVPVAVMAGKAHKTIETVTTNPPETNNARDMHVFVRIDDPAKTLADTKGYTFGAVENYTPESTASMIARISEATGEAPAVIYYETNILMADALFSGEIRGLIMNGAGAALLMEEAGYENFMERARILDTVAYTPPAPEPTEPEPTVGDITNTPFIVYISGSDTRSQKLNVSRSDVNILMVVNPVTKQILLLNTPRDYYVANPAGEGALDKLTHCGLYGPDCSMKALEGLYGINIDYYGQINFTGFKTLVDAVGGITVNSDQAFSINKDIHIQKGENFLNGEQALAFARDRKHVNGGDNGRGKNQMKVITAVIKKMTSGTTLLMNYMSIMESLEGTFTTDIQMDDITALVRMQLNDMASWEIHSFAVTGTGGSEKTYSSPGHTAYVMYPNKAVVKQASDLVEKVLSGGKLTAEDLKIK